MNNARIFGDPVLLILPSQHKEKGNLYHVFLLVLWLL